MSTDKKKDRDSNFSVFETNYLIECVSEHLNILENKKTDSNTTKSKKDSWNAIAKAFKENPDCKPRIPAQLESKWKNLKTSKATVVYYQDVCKKES
uniref:Regulatory protein zeste n=1 Tax=Romanomermis culicivorax TaxID=13658 RepID=A0A915KXC2_ROMCU